MSNSTENNNDILGNVSDEYEAGKGLILIFSSDDFKNKIEEIRSTMKVCGQEVQDEHVFKINSKKEVESALNDVVKIYLDKLENNIKFLIIYFFGKLKKSNPSSFLAKDEVILFQDIWSTFLDFEIPKIYFLESYVVPEPKQEIEFDTVKFCSPDNTDEIKICEANNMVICRYIDDKNDTYMETLCNNIKIYGKMDDIFDIILRTNVNTCVKNPPRIITTFLKKFYFLKSDLRGYQYEILETFRKLRR